MSDAPEPTSMTGPTVGGRRRIDRVLAPDFLAGLGEQSIEHVREMRRDAEQEESDLSYVRRLLQGRLDILRAEQSRRASGAQPLEALSERDFVERLARTLTDSGPRSDWSHARLPHVDPSRVGEHRRRVEQLASDVGFSDLEAMSDDDVAAALERLIAFEEDVSRSRRAVQQVVDACTQEIGRRYKEGSANVADLLREA